MFTTISPDAGVFISKFPDVFSILFPVFSCVPTIYFDAVVLRIPDISLPRSATVPPATEGPKFTVASCIVVTPLLDSIVIEPPA